MWMGCSSTSQLDAPTAGRTLIYTPGVPNFDMETVATWHDGEAGVDLYLSIPKASLIFLRQGLEYMAQYEAIVQIKDRDGKEILTEEAWNDTVRVDTYADTQAFDSPLIIERRILLEPGEYVIETTLQDENSEAVAIRAARVAVPTRDFGEVSLSGLRLEGKSADEPFAPLIAFHMPSGMDSLRTIVELYDTPDQGLIDLQMVLVRFESDTLVAAPPYWISPGFGSLGYRGVDYAKPDTIQSTRRSFRNLDREVTVVFSLPALEPGNYRLEIQAELAGGAIDSTGQTTLLQRARDLSVKHPEFPRVTRLHQAVLALRYIAYEKEVWEILHAEDEEEMRRRFDTFWGTLVRNKQVAGNLIKQYYGRVEQANLFFTTHKEGWKTDRGMVYIVLGAPAYVENLIDAEIWHYSYSDRDPLNTFYFQKTRTYDSAGIYRNYILARRSFYERSWIRAVDRWRSGLVL